MDSNSHPFTLKVIPLLQGSKPIILSYKLYGSKHSQLKNRKNNDWSTNSQILIEENVIKDIYKRNTVSSELT